MAVKFGGQKPRIHIGEDNTCNRANISLSKRLGYGTLAFTSIACYLNSLEYDLVHDDVFAIKDNLDIRPETPLQNLFSNDFWGKPMWSNTSHKSYRPLCTLTFRMNYAAHGLNPFGYHAVNVVLHSLVCLLYTFVSDVVVFKSFPPAFLAGILFSTHPVHTEAVTGVVGRADVMGCLLILLSFLAFVRSTESKSGYSLVYIAACVLFGSMAMLVKEHGITVFGVCIVYDCLVINKVSFWRLLKNREILSFESGTAKLLYMRILILSAAVVSLMTFRIWMLGGCLPNFTKQDNPASFSDSLGTRIMTYWYLIAFNAWLLLSPSVLSYDWQMGSIPLVESVLDSRNSATFVFIVLAALLVYSALFSKNIDPHEQDILVLSLAFMVIPFLPASNLFFRVGFVVAERILYVPSMGFCILVVCGLQRLASVGSQSASDLRGINHGEMKTDFECPNTVVNSKLHRVVLFSVFALIGLFCCKIVVRNRVWSSRETLFRSGVETLPHNAKAHYNFANFLKDVGRNSEAIQHYEAALQLAPDHVSSHNNLGTLLDNNEEAIKHFYQAIKHDPYHANSYFNLGTRMASLKRLPEAEKMLQEALRINPTYVDAVLNLAGVMNDQGKVDEAEGFYKRALSLQPGNADAYNNYAVFLGKMGRTKQAFEQYHAALQLNPKHSVALVNMARELRAAGNIQEAEQIYKRALSIKKEASTLQLLGVLYYHDNRLNEAEVAWKEAIGLDPSNIDTRSNYAILLGRTNRLNEAVSVLKGLVLDDPHNREHYKTLSGMYAQNGQINQALQIIASALNVCGGDADLYFHQGNLYKDLNEMQQAKKSFQKSLQLDPNHFSANLNLGVVFHLEGNYADARRHYETAFKQDPSNTILKQNLAKLQRLEMGGIRKRTR